MSVLMKIYQRLPAFLRSHAASWRGRQLHRWRYGPQAERLVAEAYEREAWDARQWTRYQEERLAYVLHRAATKVPYYRELWARRRRQGDHRSWEELAHWPILEKQQLRAHPESFVADDCHRAQMYSEQTSGTTGTPLRFWLQRESIQAYYALVEARCRGWHGVSRHERWALLGAKIVVPYGQRRPPYWVYNSPMNQLYLSIYHLSEETVGNYLDALRKYEATHLYGYCWALYTLARLVVQQNRDDVKLKVVLTQAEPLYPHHRAMIERAFHCPVRETYGMAEYVTMASECPQGRLHLWPELGWLETLDGEEPVPPGRSGEVVATSLLNADMPLVRYRVGDRIRRAPPDERCACGRRLPLLQAVEGRIDDLLYTPDGRYVAQLYPILATARVHESQLVQETLRRVRVRYVPAPGFTESDARSIVDNLRARMGDVEVLLEPVTSIPRTAGGKFQFIICQLPDAQRQEIEKGATYVALSGSDR